MKTPTRSAVRLIPIATLAFLAATTAPGTPPTSVAASPAAVGPQPSLIATATFTRLADTTMNAPGQTTVFSTFSYPVASGGNVAFSGFYNQSRGSGAYTVAAGTSRLTRIADETTTAVGQSTPLIDIGAPVMSGGNVAFNGSFDSSPANTAIYTGVAGKTGVTCIVDSNMNAPGQNSAFYNIGLPDISANRLAFSSQYDFGSGVGIYTAVAGTSGAACVADLSTIPSGGSAPFDGFGAFPAISGNQVAFYGGYDRDAEKKSIFTGVAGTTGATRLADSTMTAPGQSTVFSNFDEPRMSDGHVLFTAKYNADNGSGIYTGVAGTTGATRIADTSTTAPGQTTTFRSFDSPVISGSSVVFLATCKSTDNAGIYAGVAGTTGVTRIADYSTTVPGQSSTFASFFAPAISGGNVVFTGGSQRSGIYLYQNGALYDVITEGESLFGGTVSSLYFRASGRTAIP